MIENAVLKYLGIYQEHIDEADELCERVCKEHSIDSDSEVWEYVKQDFEENVWQGHQLSNEIIYYIFRNLKAALVESGKYKESQIDWYINGLDTHFYINGDEVA